MNVTSYIQKLKTVFRSEHENEPNPRRDWAVIVVLLALGLVASVWWNVNYFFEVVTETDTTSTPTASETSHEASVQTVEERFMERKEEAQRYKNDTSFVDPSN